ncbi:hypothetical protein ACKVM7_003230, partial [Arthrobacter russicus]
MSTETKADYLNLWWDVTGGDWPIPDDIPAEFACRVLELEGKKPARVDPKPGVWIVGSYDEEVKAVYQDELQARRHAMENGQNVYFWKF